MTPPAKSKFLSEISTTTDLGHDAVAFNTTLSNLSLGFDIQPVKAQAIPVQSNFALDVQSVSGDVVVSMMTENDGQKYEIMKSTDLKVWTKCVERTGDGGKIEFSEKAVGNAYFRATKTS